MYNEETQQLTEQTQQPVEQQTQPQQESTYESTKEYNLRLLRERAEAAERRAAQLEYERQVMQQQQQQQQLRTETIEDFDVDDDGYIEGRQLKRYVKAFKSEIEYVKKEHEKKAEELKQSMAMNALQTQYKDFSSVVNEENVRKLQQEYPEIIESIAMNPDVYKRGTSLYNLIKKTNTVSTSNYAPVKPEIPMPRSAAGVGAAPSQSPLINFQQGDRRILSEADKAAVRKRVEDLKSRSY